MALWTPADTTTALWLDAADSSTLFDAVSGGSLPANGVGVARWHDKSGNARHATQAESGSRPTRSVSGQNGLDVLNFDGSDVIKSPDWYSSDLTGFVLARKPNTNEQRFVGKFNGFTGNREYLLDATSVQRMLKNATGVSGGDNQLVSGEVIGSNYNVLGFIKSGTSCTLSLNGSLTSGSFGNATVFNGNEEWAVGGDGASSFLVGQIAEVVLIGSAVTTNARQNLEGYLAWKWGLQSNLPNNHTYKNGPPVKGGLSTIVASHYAALGI